ncbi:peptidase U32 family protein [Ruminiclostridium josui]|uniref:peptidase U32 family protein n=1 Tax=Ruminiclostridium josui TaxID=1499 RepID=UPI000B20D258|nr:U32 family peptidase [Ruminiclostridium josui]
MAKKIELLAPAGTYDAFLAAIENGADAVYLGGKLLNARAFAGNFDEEQLERALDYAHTRDTSIFLTMNTLVLDSEMQEAVEYAAKAYEMGVDAFIVQDVGLAANLKKLIPGITLHASTQMTIYSTEGIKAIEPLGFDRIVLARELNLEEVKSICGQTSLEIEVFVHGALCICVSGQCYMSSMIGGRSGNRGKCAQPCRMPYSIKRDGNDIGSGYLISPKDICYIDHLAELVAGGVTSLKIEGRMKSPEYVASVVGTYRKYLDLIYETKGISDSKKGIHKVSQEDRHKLLQSFNRGGFSKGYLLGKTGPEMMAYEKPKNWGTPLGSVVTQDKSTNSVLIKLENTLGMGDGIEIWSGSKFQESPGGIITKIVKDKKLVRKAHKGDTVWVSVIKGNVGKGSRVYKTSDKEMLEQAAATYSKGSRKSPIKANFTMKYGQVPVLNLQDAYGNTASAAGEQFPQKAVNKPLTKERILEQLKKMGTTPFYIMDINLDIDEDAVIPISELNNIRRSAAEQLEQKRILSFKKELTNFDKSTLNSILYFPGNVQKKNKDKKISAIFYDYPDKMGFGDLDIDRVYLLYGNNGK